MSKLSKKELQRISDALTPTTEKAPEVKVLYPIGAGLDIPTGVFLKGTDGQYYLNGGLGTSTGITGKGNSFKSTIGHFFTLSMLNRLASCGIKSSELMYDTEINIHLSTLTNFLKRFKHLKDFIKTGRWTITDKTVMKGDEFHNELKRTFKEKVAKKIKIPTPFFNLDESGAFDVTPPHTNKIDSLTVFDTTNIANLQEEIDLGDKKALTLPMRQGLEKSRFLSWLPTAATNAGAYVVTTAHMAKDIPMESGPMAPRPEKKLSTMKPGVRIKGVTDAYLYLISNLWETVVSRPLINRTTKAPEYPIDSTDNSIEGNDLYLVTINLLRSKSGPSGTLITLIISQSEGVLPTLSEFNAVKDNKRFGLTGNDINYVMTLYPEVKLSRTKVRNLIDTDHRLRRAINITAELLQLRIFQRLYWGSIWMDPAALYEAIIEKGYSWEKILDSRGWWSLNNDANETPYLCIIDLLLMANGKVDRNEFKTGANSDTDATEHKRSDDKK